LVLHIEWGKYKLTEERAWGKKISPTHSKKKEGMTPSVVIRKKPSLNIAQQYYMVVLQVPYSLLGTFPRTFRPAHLSAYLEWKARS